MWNILLPPSYNSFVKPNKGLVFGFNESLNSQNRTIFLQEQTWRGCWQNRNAKNLLGWWTSSWEEWRSWGSSPFITVFSAFIINNISILILNEKCGIVLLHLNDNKRIGNQRPYFVPESDLSVFLTKLCESNEK